MVTKKKSKVKKTKKKRIQTPKHEKDIQVEKILIENFVSLQKVMTNLSLKFGELSENIKKLLDIFETAAKSLSKQGLEPSDKKEAQNIINKLDGLAEQNKLIAKGLTLLHEKSTPQKEELTEIKPQNPITPKRVEQPVLSEKARALKNPEEEKPEFNTYQQSISGK